MSDEKLKAKMEQVTGSVKESLGKLSGDKSLETEGKVNKTTGKVDEVAADTKDALDGLAKGLKIRLKSRGELMSTNDIKSTLTYDDKVIEKLLGMPLKR